MTANRFFRLAALVMALCAVALPAAAQSASLKTWYLAEGTTYGPFDEFVLIANPNQGPVTAKVTLLRPPISVGGILTPQSAIVHTYPLLATSRTTVWITRDIPELFGVGTDVSVVVECLEQDGTTPCSGDKGIVVERSMYWPRSNTGSMATWQAGHNAMGLAAPATRWYLAEGATWIFDEYILLANASKTETAHVSLTFQGQAPNRITKTITRALLPETRMNVVPREEPDTVEFRLASFSVEIKSGDAGYSGDAGVPILAERSMYWPAAPSGAAATWRGGHGSAAIPAAAVAWNFAEGFTGQHASQQFDTYLLIENPDPVQTAHVKITYYLDSQLSSLTETDVPVGPQSRFTRWVNSIPELVNRSFGIRVESVIAPDASSAVPVVAERAMYWGTQPVNPLDWSSANWVEGHDSPGVPVESTKWGFAEGTAENGFYPYFLLRNSTAQDTNVKFTFMLEDGTGATSTCLLKANSRYTVSIDQFPPSVWGRRFAAFLESVPIPIGGSPVPFVAERAVYWGTNTNWLGGHASAGIPWPDAAVVGTPGTPPSTPAPTVASITPDQGPVTGGTVVTIRGTGFVWPTVTIGGVAATSVAWPLGDSTTLTATVSAHAAGVVDVVVKNKDNQTGTLSGGYTYGTPPTITGVSPASGSMTGGTPLTITGTHLFPYLPSQTTVRIGGVLAPTQAYGSDTEIHVVTGSIGATGTYDVVVINPDGLQATLVNGFTCLPPGPSITNVTPNQGPTAGGTSITITGTNFRTGAIVRVGGVSAAVSSLDATQIVATTGAHATGTVDVVVTNTDDLQSATRTGAFIYGTLAKLAFGDSLTVGPVVDEVVWWATQWGYQPYFSPPTYPSPYPATLAALLPAVVDNLGVEGEATPSGLYRLPTVISITYDVVIILEGTNDANGIFRTDTAAEQLAKAAAIASNLAAMVGQARGQGQKVVLATLPPTVPIQFADPNGYTRYRGAELSAILLVNAAISQIFDAYRDDPYFVGADVYRAMMDASGNNPASLLSMDGLHPKAEGYDVIANAIHAAIVSKF